MNNILDINNNNLNDINNELDDNDNELDENDNVLDDEWITHFEETDQLYKKYYNDDIREVNIDCIFINKKNEIEELTETISILYKKKNDVLQHYYVR